MDSHKLNIGLIGYGYWGTNILRNIVLQPYSGKVFVCDINTKRQQDVRSLMFNIEVCDAPEIILENQAIDAVIIATPTHAHYHLAKAALLKGKHVLVEKPLATSSAEVEELILIAIEKGLILMVDHIYLYNPAVHQLKKYISNAFLGNINYIDSTRINLGVYQDDINVLWDLACHDIYIINYLIDDTPAAVRAIGKFNFNNKVEDLAYLFLYYTSGLLVQIKCSWASPVKIRNMIIGGDKKMIIYDDIASTNKLVIYDYSNTTGQDENKAKLVDYRLGDVTIPKFEITEPLRNVIDEFYNCILLGQKPLADGTNALKVVKVLEAAEKSLKSDGIIIPVI